MYPVIEKIAFWRFFLLPGIDLLWYNKNISWFYLGVSKKVEQGTQKKKSNKSKIKSFLILDADLEVVSANQIFYQTFRVLPEQTEGRSLYELGNGQWNIPKLKIAELKKEIEDLKKK